MRRLVLLLGALFHASVAVATPLEKPPYIPGSPVGDDFEGFAQIFLENHCIDCHGDTTIEGDLSLIEVITNVFSRFVWVARVIQQVVGELKCDPKVHAIIMQCIGFCRFRIVEKRRAMAGRRKQGSRFAANNFLVLLGLCIRVAGMHKLHDLARSNGVSGFCHMSKQWQVGQTHH